MLRPANIVALVLLVFTCANVIAEDEPQVLLEQATKETDRDTSLKLLDGLQAKLSEGLPEEAKARARLWLALADERMRRWDQRKGTKTSDEREQLIEAHRFAYREAGEAGDWPLVRMVAERVFQRTSHDDRDFAELRRDVLEYERIACQEMADQPGEAQVLLRILDEPTSLSSLGDRRSEAKARLKARLDLIADARRLLADQKSGLLALDKHELETLRFSPLPDRLQALARARDHAERIGTRDFPDDWGQSLILSELAEAAEKESFNGWSEEVRQLAARLWKIRIQEADQQTATTDPVERTGALIRQVHARRIASLIAGEALAAGVPQEFLTAIRSLPAPESSASAAEARLWLSRQAQVFSPAGDEWVSWAQSAYAARPGVFHWCDEKQVRIPDSHTAVDWMARSRHSDERGRVICLREAAKAWAELGRRTREWLPLALAEDCLQRAGLPSLGYLPAVDPTRAASQGPDTATLDQLCRQMANIPQGEDVRPALDNLLSLLHLTWQRLPPKEHGGGGENIDFYPTDRYTGQLPGITATALAWHLGKQATADLAAAYTRHGHPVLIDLIGWLAGSHAVPAMQGLWPLIQQHPDDVATWLPGWRRGIPDLLPGWLDTILPALDDRSLTILAGRAGRSLEGPALERVANEVIRRGNGEILEDVVAWWASDHRRLDASRLLDLWQRVHHWEVLRIYLVRYLTSSNDPRVPWWLLAVADGKDGEIIRAAALDGLAFLRVKEAAALCDRLLSVTSDERWLQAAALLTTGALGNGEDHRELAKRWLTEMEDDPEDERVRAARCLLAALDGGGEHRAWIEQAAAEVGPHRLIHDLCRTRLPGAHAPAFALVQRVRAEWLREDRKDGFMPAGWNMQRAARWVSLLPLDATQRQEWEHLLQQPIPPPSPEPVPPASWKFSAHPPSPGLRPPP